MVFPEEFLRFLAPEADRLGELRALLSRRGLSYRLLAIGERRHVLVRLGRGSPRFIVSAHYDRVPGSPGFLDNSAACLELADFGERVVAKLGVARSQAATGLVANGVAERSSAPELRSPERSSEGLFLLFTDGEEAPGTGGPLDQGSYALSLALRAALGSEAIAALVGFLVVDVTGRGGRLLFSRAPAALLERHGLAGTALAQGLASLERLCLGAARRAGLAEPLRLPLPWSDDLGFLLGGLPALSVSLLPDEEAQAYAGLCAAGDRAVGGRGSLRGQPGAPGHEEAGSAWPASWDFLHSVNDGPKLASEASFALMASFLDSLLS
jgi:hypothetical protein